MEELSAHAKDARFRIDGDLEIPILVALLHGGHEVLAPVLDPFQRTLEQLRRGRHRDILGIDAQLRPEAAADIGRCHAQARFVDAQKGAEILIEVVRLSASKPTA